MRYDCGNSGNLYRCVLKQQGIGRRTIKWGINDSGIVVGVELSREAKDAIRRKITERLNQIQPYMSADWIHIDFCEIMDESGMLWRYSKNFKSVLRCNRGYLLSGKRRLTVEIYYAILTIRTKVVKKEASYLPKSYSEQEKAYIKKRLKEEAAKCLATYGIRRTTVDELVKRVKIPKGTFYLFYPSKEMLLFEVILEQHDRIEYELKQAIAGISGEETTAEQVTDIIFRFFKEAADSPVLRMMNSDEVELLARKLPPEIVEEHLRHDDSMVEQVFSTLLLKPGANAEAFSAAFRAIYFATLQKENIGEEQFDAALRLLIHGLVLQFM